MRRSVESYGTLLGPPMDDGAQLDAALLAALDAFIAGAEAAEDGRKNTARALTKARSAVAVLRSGRALPWSGWARLAALAPSKKLDAFADPVRDAAAKHDVHPLLRDDIRRAIEVVFTVAAKALETYGQGKKDRGVIDFTDQEAFALAVLEGGLADARLEGGIDLLLVDEFQDTSPIQLAIFAQLARRARRSVWVGDQKQAVYGFRGADPALMDAAITTILGEAEPETLKKSWRSRPALVDLTSDLFSTAFAEQGVPASRVRLDAALSAADEAQDLGPVIERWTLESKNKGTDAACLAAGVRQMLADSEVRVRDEEQVGQSRPVRLKDVAILCRKNATCADVASELEALGVPAVLAQTGLLETLEGVTCVSALRLLIDPRDALALAQLSRLLGSKAGSDGDEQAWLQALLNAPFAKAFTDLPEVGALKAVGDETFAAGVLTSLDKVLEAAGIRELCRRWGDAPGRLANVDRLRAHAVAYVADCEGSGAGCTLAGLVGYLEDLAATNNDSQAVSGAEDAVSVVTWHAAKGLEWPVAILFELEKGVRASAMGVAVVNGREAFSLEDPLAERWIRYWPFPYDKRQKGMPLLRRHDESSEAKVAWEREQRQEMRLLYVGWTRARDRLVLATRAGNLGKGMLVRLKADDGEALREPEDGCVSWGKEAVAAKARMAIPGAAVAVLASPAEAPVASGPKEHAPATIQPSSVVATNGREATLGEVQRIGVHLAVRGKPEMSALGQALHGFLAADRGDLSAGERQAMALGLLARWGVTDCLDEEEVIVASDHLHAWVEERWPGATWRCEWPILQRNRAGSLVQGIADLVLELAEGLVIIDHKSFPGSLGDAITRAPDYGPQLQSYARALQAATGKPVLSCYLHFPLVAACVEVMVEVEVEDGGDGETGGGGDGETGGGGDGERPTRPMTQLSLC
ncbi:MAG: UvrD-helicase domain-containing protein [Deltaproteobacteria bacterium]|nr:UvrD-helicase domain-containing protein [Deltaproteobacteria bacterium]